MDAEAARIAILKEKGAEHGVQDWIIQAAIHHGVPWLTVEADLKKGITAATQIAAGFTPEDQGQMSIMAQHATQITLRTMAAQQTATLQAIPDEAQLHKEGIEAAGSVP